ncbi:MAG: Ycf66 family protein [Cyanobacteria bacterium P01_H01_bin.35]
MLANILALAVGLGSLALYLVAFFFPEVHRKNDFIWSGVGLFYALVLWFCAGRITGAVLLGQLASVSLLGWFAWETLALRRQVTPVAEQTKISTQESTQDNTQEKSTTISEATSIPKLENIPKLDLSESVESSIEEFVNEVKPGETESELLSYETTSDSSKMTKESEVDTTESMAEENVLTDDKTLSETSKKAGGFSQLLIPVSGILNNIKNAIQGRDNKNTDSELASIQIQADTEKFSSIEEVTSEVNKTIIQTEETQPEEESLMEKEESMVSDVQIEQTTLTEVEKEATSSSEAESTSTEKAIAETSKLAEVSEVEDSSTSPEKVTNKDSQNEE